MNGSSDAKDLQLADFKIEKKLGEGGFGVVYKAIWKKKEKKVAIKEVIPNARLSDEVNNHKSFEHENIVSFIGYFEEKHKAYIVMELCDLGSIRDYVKKNGPLTTEQAVPVINQIVLALQYLHSKNVCHRDITAGNVLVQRIRSNGALIVKLCDFGISKAMDKRRVAHTVVGTPGYMDPHMRNASTYDNRVDLYSLGCVLYMMLSGKEPSSPPDDPFPRLNQLDPSAIELIQQLTCSNVNKRIQLRDIKHSSFMDGNNHAFRSRSIGRRSISNQRGISASPNYPEQQSAIRERSKSRGPTEYRTRSPNTRQTVRYRRNSRAPLIECQWPINIDRLKGKHEESDGYRLDIASETNARLSKNRKTILKILVDTDGQHVGIPKYDSAGFDWYKSRDKLPISHAHLYNKVLDLLEQIRWKAAKVIFHDASNICPGATIRLMENGDMRMKDAQGILYSVKNNSDTVHIGNPKNPTGVVTNSAKMNEILKFRELCKRTEQTFEELGFAFPQIFTDTKDDTKKENDAARVTQVDSNRLSGAPVLRERSASKNRSAELPARTRSSCPTTRRSVPESRATNRSDPVHSMQQPLSGSQARRITISKTKTGEVVGVKDKIDDTAMRTSSAGENHYVYTNADGREIRFEFHGDYRSLKCSNKEYLLRKLRDLRGEN